MITLEELAANSDDKLVQGFINEVITESYLLSRMTFDDCLASTGTSDLVYAYKRLKTPKTAAFRALNTEPAKSKVEVVLALPQNQPNAPLYPAGGAPGSRPGALPHFGRPRYLGPPPRARSTAG